MRGYDLEIMDAHEESPIADGLIERAQAGDATAAADLFNQHRARLRKMLRFRLDHRLQRRLDTSDVLQEVYVEMARSIADYRPQPGISFYFWLRTLATRELLQTHRRHLGTQKRDAGLEVSLHRGAMPAASSASIAQQFLGHLTSPTQAVQRAELQVRLQDALNDMDAFDREIIVLRHFEELSNTEAAELLGIPKSTASKRYFRALLRLKKALADRPGFFEE